MRVVSWLGLGALVFVVGCGKDEAKGDGAGTADVEETGVDVEKNPLGALGQLAEVGKEMAEKAEKAEKHKPVDPVPFAELLPLLPKADGWEPKGDPKAETTQMGEFKISTANQRYERKEGDKRQTMKVTIVDGSYVPMVYAPFTMMSKFSREGTDGHSKGLKIEGEPAFEEWKKKSGKVTLTVLVKDRFLITIDGRGVEEKEARNWAGLLAFDTLKKWAKEEK